MSTVSYICTCRGSLPLYGSGVKLEICGGIVSICKVHCTYMYTHMCRSSFEERVTLRSVQTVPQQTMSLYVSNLVTYLSLC